MMGASGIRAVRHTPWFDWYRDGSEERVEGLIELKSGAIVNKVHN